MTHTIVSQPATFTLLIESFSSFVFWFVIWFLQIVHFQCINCCGMGMNSVRRGPGFEIGIQIRCSVLHVAFASVSHTARGGLGFASGSVTARSIFGVSPASAGATSNRYVSA